MIAAHTEDHESGLVVTLPAREKIGVFLLLIGVASVLVWYLHGLSEFGVSEFRVTIFIAVGLLINLLFFWEKVIVSRESVRKRVLRWRQVELPRNVTVGRHGPLVVLRDAESQFEYRFPKYMNHGADLERALRIFFHQVDQDSEAHSASMRARSDDSDDLGR